MVEAIPVASILRVVLGWVPSFLLRWYYSPDRLARLIHVDLKPREDSALLNLAPASWVRVAMQVINLSPFPVELDRASLQIDCGGTRLGATNVERKRIKPGEIAVIPFETAVPDGHAEAILQHNPDSSGGVSGTFEFNCRVQPFTRMIPDLRGITFRRLNAHRRKGAV